MPIGQPSCRKCLGSGEREIITVHDGVIAAINYERCSCTYHAQWADEEDWSSSPAKGRPNTSR